MESNHISYKFSLRKLLLGITNLLTLTIKDKSVNWTKLIKSEIFLIKP